MSKKTKQPAPVSVDQTVSDAFRDILRHNLDYLTLWEEAARSWDDIEGVHQMRVAFRRMRSALTVFRSAIPRPVTDSWSEEMRWLANQLGPARDLDVFIDEGLGAVSGKLPLAGERKLLELAERHRANSYQAVNAMLDSDRYPRFKQDFGDWVDSSGWLGHELSGKHRTAVEQNLVPFARRILDKQERRVLSAGSHVNTDSADEMHQLRIECKKLRYAAEFFLPVFYGMDEFIGHMKGLQDLLGVLNDVSVMRQLLDGLLQDARDPEVLEYAGGLVGWRTCQYYAMKGTFDACWEEFTHAKHPWWKKAALVG